MSVIGLGTLPAQEPLPKPDAQPDPTALATIIIPDLKTALTHIELLAQRFSPDTVKPGMLAAMLGGPLGDPGLSTLENKPVIVVVAPGVPIPTLAFIVPSTKAQGYLDAGAALGMVMGKTVDDLAILARDPDGQALGERVAASYASLIATPVKGDLRILTAPDKLFATYGPFMTMGLQRAAMQMAKQPGQELAAKILPLEAAFLLAVASEITASQVDVALDAQTVAFDSIIAAKPGSALAKALVAPSAALIAGGAAATARLSPAPGAMDMAGAFEADAARVYLLDLLGRMQAQPAGKDLITADVIDSIASSAGLWTGTMAYHMRQGTGGPLQLEGASGITDAPKVRALMQKIVTKLYGPNGALATMMQTSGLSVEMKTDVRVSGGIPVDKVATTVDKSKVPPEQLALREATAMSYEVAYTPQFSFLASDPKVLDGLIAGKQGGMTLTALRTIGPGRSFYADFSLGEFAHFVGSVPGPMPQPMKDALIKLKPGTPVAAAVSLGDGRARQEWRIPVTSILDIVTAVKAASGKGPAPAPAADPGF
jgi:hypothetical protein